MISIAVLVDLERNPIVAYDGYDDLRAEARRRTGGPINPADLPVYAAVIRTRGVDWCRSVLGHDIPPNALGRGGLPWLEVEMLRIADERDLDPAMPDWLFLWKAQSDATLAARDAAALTAEQQDRNRWADALEACKVPVEVRANLGSAQVRHGRRVHLRHVVPLIDAMTSRRHPAGMALCERPGRWKPRELSDPVGEPATCVSCLKFTPQIRVAKRPRRPGPETSASDSVATLITVFRAQHQAAGADGNPSRLGVERFTLNMARHLAGSNPGFDAARFMLDACDAATADDLCPEIRSEVDDLPRPRPRLVPRLPE